MNSETFIIDPLELKKRIDKIALALGEAFFEMSKSLVDLKKTFKQEGDWILTKKYLDSLSLEELEDFVFSNNEERDTDFIHKLFTYYTNRTRYELLKKCFQTLVKVLKNINNLKKVLLQNKREIIRRIYSFLFKNLDDTHTITLFN